MPCDTWPTAVIAVPPQVAVNVAVDEYTPTAAITVAFDTPTVSVVDTEVDE